MSKVLKYFSDDYKELLDFINSNIGRIEKFEYDEYFTIHFNDGTHIKVDTDYGGLYFTLKSDANE